MAKVKTHKEILNNDIWKENAENALKDVSHIMHTQELDLEVFAALQDASAVLQWVVHHQ